MILTWFSKTQKMARTRCPEDGIPIDPQLPQVLRASNNYEKQMEKTKWNKHVKMMVTLQKKKKILREVLAIVIPCPLQEAKVIQNPQSAFFPTHNQPESGTSPNCFHCNENDIFQPTPLRHQYVLLTQTADPSLNKPGYTVSNSYGASL